MYIVAICIVWIGTTHNLYCGPELVRDVILVPHFPLLPYQFVYYNLDVVPDRQNYFGSLEN